MLKFLIFFISFIIISPVFAGNIGDDCTYNGIKLSGRVKVVDMLADFKVKKVQHFEDLRVKTVNALPSDCGEWEYVDMFEDFSIEFVEHFEDFSIKEVDVFPGI